MKSIQIFATICFIIAVSTSNASAQNAKKEVKKEMASTVYACPMHPTVTGKKGDKCPKCEMKLVEKKAKKEAAVVYVCPMKCEGSTSDKPGDCPKCGMKLVAANDKKDGHKGHNHK